MSGTQEERPRPGPPFRTAWDAGGRKDLAGLRRYGCRLPAQRRERRAPAGPSPPRAAAPNGLVDPERPLDRAPYEGLVTAVLAWQDPNLTPRDYEQIALQLTGHARAVAADVQRHAAALPENDAAAPSPTSSSAKPPAASPSRSRAPHTAPRTAPGSYGPSTNAWTAWRPRPSTRRGRVRQPGRLNRRVPGRDHGPRVVPSRPLATAQVGFAASMYDLTASVMSWRVLSGSRAWAWRWANIAL